MICSKCGTEKFSVIYELGDKKCESKVKECVLSAKIDTRGINCVECNQVLTLEDIGEKLDIIIKDMGI